MLGGFVQLTNKLDGISFCGLANSCFCVTKGVSVFDILVVFFVSHL